ncbi:MAG: KTSC domain-containing protein [Filimonas sp.]|nr:KTSC domain-containing protein [Filimonas sp.]
MLRKQIQSSIITSVGYETIKSLLEVEFTSGEVFQYFNVPLETYSGLIKAKSHGEFFNEFIKEQYEFRKLEKEM